MPAVQNPIFSLPSPPLPQQENDAPHAGNGPETSIIAISRPGEDSPGVGQLVQTLFHDVSLLVQQHLTLGRLELREESARMARVGGMMMGASMFVQVALAFVGLALLFVFATQVPLWAASGIVALLFVAVAGLMAWRGRETARQIRPPLAAQFKR